LRVFVETFGDMIRIVAGQAGDGMVGGADQEDLLA
jgi:hypothetical protein